MVTWIFIIILATIIVLEYFLYIDIPDFVYLLTAIPLIYASLRSMIKKAVLEALAEHELNK